MRATLRACSSVLVLMALAAAGRAQDEGHSYIRIAVNGHPASNIVWDKKHSGWMGVTGVEARLNRVRVSASGATNASAWVIQTSGAGKTFTSIPKPGGTGRSTLRAFASSRLKMPRGPRAPLSK